ncbi:MAG: hypothetical protein ACLR3O_04925 [Streptococcus sp.]
MSNEKVLAALFERIEIGKSYYFEGAYYRLKDYGDHIYGLQRAIPGMCGEKTASPSIKFYWKNGVLDYQFYVDFEASPMIMKAYSSTDHAFFEQAFENLLHDFEDILENQENSLRSSFKALLSIFSVNLIKKFSFICKSIVKAFKLGLFSLSILE